MQQITEKSAKLHQVTCYEFDHMYIFRYSLANIASVFISAIYLSTVVVFWMVILYLDTSLRRLRAVLQEIRKKASPKKNVAASSRPACWLRAAVLLISIGNIINTEDYVVQSIYMFWAARGQHMPPVRSTPTMPLEGNIN